MADRSPPKQRAQLSDAMDMSPSAQQISSSPAPASSGNSSTKPRKPPPVTPNSFRRFFTPRATKSNERRPSRARQALKDITTPAINRSLRSRLKLEHQEAGFSDINIFEDGPVKEDPLTPIRKRRLLLSPGASGESTRNFKRRRTYITRSKIQARTESLTVETDTSSTEDSEEENTCTNAQQLIRRPRDAFLPVQLLNRSLGGTGGARFRNAPKLGPSWPKETSRFFSRPSDAYWCRNEGHASLTLPFCSASCTNVEQRKFGADRFLKANSLVAIGDEDGGVRLLEAADDGKPPFQIPYLHFQPHQNAILDLAFSVDDARLATASGDQSARIVDMRTQQVVHNLTGHLASVKKVQFQPGDSRGNVIATSSRDGSVKIWDLRCNGVQRPAQELFFSLNSDVGVREARNTTDKVTWLQPVNAIVDAHADRRTTSINSSHQKQSATPDNPSRTEQMGRRGGVSVTTLTFLQPGREHLLLTASEANACIKVWDLRAAHSSRRNGAVVLSTTKQPESHDKHRLFGVNSLCLNGDGSRVYSLCRDSTIYAYSTNHLILGHAPELDPGTSRARRSAQASQEGLGPLYGFRHPQFRATTFYVKMSLRRAVADRSEMLAVGSGDGCAIIFPTDERCIEQTRTSRGPSRAQRSQIPEPPATPRPALRRISSGFGRLNDTIPIYEQGTALIKGHQREVSDVSWTHNGDLITIGDDSLVRRWREGSDAKEIRKGGESEGKRWQCGWADASDSEGESD